MSIKFSTNVLAVLLSTCVLGQANADPIISEPYFTVGNNYTDSAAIEWEYLGFFDLAAGPDARDNSGVSLDVPLYNGLEAAFLLFNKTGDTLQNFALSAFGADANVDGVMTAAEIADSIKFDKSHADVNHSSWYDSFDDNPGVNVAGESINADNAGLSGKYDAVLDISAYVNDRAVADKNLNYVFKAVDVPEPSTLAIFALALCGLGVRRFK